MTAQEADEKIKELGEKYSYLNDSEAYEQDEKITYHPDEKRHSHHGKKRKKKKSTAKKIVLGILLFILLLILVGAVALIIMINSGKKDLLDYSDTKIETVEEAETEDDGKTVRYNGKIYRLNENITSIACLGVDKKEINQNGVIGTAGQADTIMVIAFDTVTGAAKLISIPRDTVAPIDIYATNGSYLRTENTQICLAYAYGDGGETSCENVIASVRKIMYGIPINSYAALDMSGISVLNDKVGGVKVEVLETVGPFKKGQTVTLKGENAMKYVRYRNKDRIDASLLRMQRQLQYVREFTSTAVKKVTANPSSVTDIYNTAMKYAYTNVGLSKASYFATRFVAGASPQFENCSVPGKIVEGKDGYAEFYIEEKSFYELILSVYYNEVGTY